jgi:hypothetical protein
MVVNIAIQAAIDRAALCGIIVEIRLATTTDIFHWATARHATGGNNRVHSCARTDPVKAIQDAINGLVDRKEGTILQ